MNNMMFPLSRYLTDNGHYVTLFLLDEFEHFLPQCDVFDKIDVKIKHLGWNKFSFEKIKSKEIRSIFEHFDFFIGMHWAPAYLMKAGIKLDIFFPVGSDLHQFPFSKFWHSNIVSTLANASGWKCSKYQFYGIKYTHAISMDKNVNFESYLNKIGLKTKIRIPAFPFIYIKQYTKDYFNKSNIIDIVSKYRSQTKLMIIQQSRQEWKCGSENWHYKGNEILICGFAEFLKTRQDYSVKLLLFEYGTDFLASKKLIRDLNISEYIVWLPPSERKHIMGAISLCDVGVGIIGFSLFSYGSVFEILSLGKIFMGQRQDSDYMDRSLYPMKNVTDASEVSETLTHIYKNLESEKEKALEGINWMKKYAIEIPLKKVEELIKMNKTKSKIELTDISYMKFISVILPLLNYTYQFLLFVNRFIKTISNSNAEKK